MNGEVQETQGGIMTELGVDSQTERVISSDDAVSNNQNQKLVLDIYRERERD